jgi:hypothetical protein
MADHESRKEEKHKKKQSHHRGHRGETPGEKPFSFSYLFSVFSVSSVVTIISNHRNDTVSKDVVVIGGGIAGIQSSWIWPTWASRSTWWKNCPASAARWPSWTRPFPPTTAPSEFCRPRCWMSVDIPISSYWRTAKWRRWRGRRVISPSPCAASPLCGRGQAAPDAVPVPKNAPRGAGRLQRGAGRTQGDLQLFRPGDPLHPHHRSGPLPPAERQEMRHLPEGNARPAPSTSNRRTASSTRCGGHHRAAGYDVFDPAAMPEYRYRELPNVVTAIEFERLLSASGPTHGHLDRPSDRAVTAEIAELEKKAAKSGRMLAGWKRNSAGAPTPFTKRSRGLRRGRGPQKMGRALRSPPGRLPARWKNCRPKPAVLPPPKSWPSSSVWVPAISASTPSARAIAACTPSRRPSSPTSMNRKPPRTIFGMDIRAVGKGFEEYKVRGGNNSNIVYIGAVAWRDPAGSRQQTRGGLRGHL